MMKILYYLSVLVFSLMIDYLIHSQRDISLRNTITLTSTDVRPNQPWKCLWSMTLVEKVGRPNV